MTMTDYKPTPTEVQNLRQRTGAGMMDCRNALVETAGDVNLAVENLRKRGIAKAEKRAGRVASEGRIVAIVSPDRGLGALLELNSETDFVARNDDFGAIAQSLTDEVFNDDSLDGAVANAAESAFLAKPMRGDASKTVANVVTEASARTGENVVLRRFARFRTDGTIGSYVHHNGRVAVLVDVTGPRGDVTNDLAKRIAEHIAGSPTVPQAVRREEIPAEVVERERRIFEEKARAEGKPEAIIPKIVEGQVKRFYGDVTLLEQPWVRDDSKTIQQLVDEAAKGAGAALTVRRFVRYRMGEE
jgi:elongation factor Ts